MSLFWKRITSATAVQADSAIHLYHLLKPDDADRRKSRYWLTVIDGAIKEGSVSAVSVCVCVSGEARAAVCMREGDKQNR